MSILDTIKGRKMEEIYGSKQRLSLFDLERKIAQLPPPHDFLSAIEANILEDRVALIAEIKKASPSKGVIRTDFDVAEIAEAYREGGATCLSVLTDAGFFQGSADNLAVARAVSGLPVLRKDFIVDRYQVYESRAMDADCILLILAMLDDGQAREFEETALALGMAVLLEVHTESEMDRAMSMQSRLIGINNRDLTNFTADLGTSERLSRKTGPDRIVVSESGISDAADVVRLMKCGISAFLIGEQLIRAPDIRLATHAITSARIESRRRHAGKST